MTCDLQFLFYGDEGYIAYCKQCGHFQIVFITTMLTLNDVDFNIFCNQARYKALQDYAAVKQHSKIVMIATPAADVHLILTPVELSRLNEMLEQADNEKKAQDLLHLFKSQV